jgi:hypothetical protein
MTDRTLSIPPANAGRRRGGLQVGQSVEVTRGLLAGAGGVLLRITADSRCLIELHCEPRGVLILIDPAAVAQCPVVRAGHNRARSASQTLGVRAPTRRHRT